jgi:MFS family permease
MSLLRDRRLATLLVAEVISSTGTQMTWVALPWFVLRTTGSAERMTWVMIAEIVPIAVVGFWGGAIAARIGTRRTMLTCDVLRVPLFAAVPVLHSAGMLPFPVLLALVAASGVFLAPYAAVQRSVVPELIGEEQADVASASALFQAANRTTIFLGPPLAGVLIAIVGASDILYID